MRIERAEQGNMMDKFEARSKVLATWLLLSGFKGLEGHLQFYTTSGILSTPSDLYKLSPRHLFSNPDISEAEVFEVIDSVEKCKNMGISRVLLSLVPDLDTPFIQEITSSPRSMQGLVEQCGGSEFSEGLLEELQKLSQLGVDMSFREDPIFEELSDTPFTDKHVALAGILSAEYPVVKDSLQSLGAVIDPTVTKDTDFLLYGDDPGSALELAVRIGVKTITEADVMEMLGIEP